ncbi:transketolase [bacterium]|nr:transketolase [bacterium]
MSSAELDERSRYLRLMAIEALDGGSRGHIGSTMSLIEILRTLYDSILAFEPGNPQWPGRDRLILSKGHGCIALYVLLADRGFFPEADLRDFCAFSSPLGGHPEFGHVPGVEASTGALGHGLSLGVGMAQAAKIRGDKHHVFVILGDGELDEGSVWEAALSAAHRNLTNLTLIVDYNKMQSYGPIHDVWSLEPLADKFTAFGFSVTEVDGHDVGALAGALGKKNLDRPRAVIAHTVKGKGIDFAEGRADWHHKSRLNGEDISNLREAVKRA